MKTPEQRWQTLVNAARCDHGDGSALPEAPLGFATRVVAQAQARARAESWDSLLQGRLWRALAGAGALAVLSAIVNYPVIAQHIDQEVLAGEDPVVALVEDWP